MLIVHPLTCRKTAQQCRSGLDQWGVIRELLQLFADHCIQAATCNGGQGQAMDVGVVLCCPQGDRATFAMAQQPDRRAG
ncbi:hypothetical protein D9M73_204430 [compost metagenome]